MKRALWFLPTGWLSSAEADRRPDGCTRGYYNADLAEAGRSAPLLGPGGRPVAISAVRCPRWKKTQFVACPCGTMCARKCSS